MIGCLGLYLTNSGHRQAVGSCDNGTEHSGFRKMRGISSLIQEILASQEVLCSMELIGCLVIYLL
jgi:hypothetical protein